METNTLLTRDVFPRLLSDLAWGTPSKGQYRSRTLFEYIELLLSKYELRPELNLGRSCMVNTGFKLLLAPSTLTLLWFSRVYFGLFEYETSTRKELRRYVSSTTRVSQLTRIRMSKCLKVKGLRLGNKHKTWMCGLHESYRENSLHVLGYNTSNRRIPRVWLYSPQAEIYPAAR